MNDVDASGAVAQAVTPEAGQEADGALFIMPRPSTGQTGPVAVWVTAAGWAGAARRMWGNSWLITPEGVLQAEEARALASQSHLTARSRSWRRFVPKVAKTALKDIREARRARAFDRSVDAEQWSDRRIAFVWQRHDLFHDTGLRIARHLGVPFVLFVDAPVIWEARRWGVRRPGWGTLLEKFDENPLFRAADLIACVSDEVAAEVARRGVPADRIMVTPCGVDVHTFTPDVPGGSVRQRHGLEDAFVVGWIGSFRQFHGIDVVIEAAAELKDSVQDLALLLVGDGSERPRIEEKARALGVDRVVFTGTVAHDEIPAHLTAMDVSLISSSDAETFHYSPLKLREYMACGLPVIAPRTGELARLISDGEDGLLVPPGDASAVAASIKRLRHDPALREALGAAARASAVRHSSWDQQVARAHQAVTGAR